MINGLSEEEKYKVIRPIFSDCEYDEYHMPIIKKTDINALDWDKLGVIGLQNANIKKADKNTLVLMFNYDKTLMSLWNNPLKKIGLFQNYAAVTTPDFSVYPTMNINEIQHNVYMSRWLGATWQSYYLTVLPTVGWATPDTYDICFSGLEYGSIVVISTLGCQEHPKEFLQGFNELKLRVNPPLILVFGDMIDGMTGTFINYKYKDAFNKPYEQIKLDGFKKIFTLTEVA